MGTRSILLKKRPLWFRWDVVPFLIILPLLIQPCVKHINDSWVYEEPDNPSNSTFAFIFDHVDIEKLEPHTVTVILPIIVGLIMIVVILLPSWSITIRIKVYYQETTDKDATHVAFLPAPHHGVAGIVPFIRGNPCYAVFQQKKREYINGEWVSMKYPVNNEIQSYTQSRGLSEKEAAQRLLYYGPNEYSVPIPGFMELYLDHIRSPLFVFQVFNILVYIIDEYFIYPLMSLASVLFLEATTVRTRQSNLLELRGVETPPIPLYVCRDYEWKKTTSNAIVPGDLVLLDQEVLAPCDFVVLDGRVVVNEAMLTGESTPQVKDPISHLPPDTKLNTVAHRMNILFGGTTVQQIIPSERKGLPANGVVCSVLSTGLGSSQGRLIRTIMFSTQRISADSKDSLYLLLFLTFFALCSAGYVFYNGQQTHAINNFRLIVECLLIITSTIPPDLPMELSFGVNSALLALSKLRLYCTESFRIPFAGTVSVCCFDKTGTLTADEYKLVGVDNMKAPPCKKSAEIKGNYFNDSSSMPLESLQVIAGCHSLVRGQYGQLVGDSIEATAFNSMKLKLNTDGTVEHARCNLKPVLTFHFSSDLRRMTTVCKIEGESNLVALMKGAPEAIAEFLTEVPEGYNDTFRKYTRQGCRVLALAHRKMSVGHVDPNIDRKIIEKDFVFAGFIVFNAALKRGSEDTIVELLKSTHRCIIITGDDPLTACHVASVLHIINKPPAIHDLKITDENGNELKNDDGYAPCYTGRALDKLSPEEYTKAIQTCNIFARMSPQMKSSIVIKLNELGEDTLMCGDGTNDVGALKQAKVGVGLIEQPIETTGEDLNENYTPKLGAASIASPFVSKRGTISGCIDLIRYGRSTLSSTLDLFKQLSLNSMISAYQLSILFIGNVRFGDRQMTVFSTLMTIASASISWATPLRTLSKERPFPGQFNSYLVVSVLLQFAVHFTLLTLTRSLVFENGYRHDPFNYNARFQPNLMNTAMFIMKGEMEIITIIANYRGNPFMQSFTENKALLIGSIVSFLAVILMLLNFHPTIRWLLQIVEYPTKKFQYTLALYCFLDAFLCLLFEKVTLKYFQWKNRKDTSRLVNDDIVNSLDDYLSNDDDVLPEESYDFGFMEMMKQNVEMQKTIKDRNTEIAIQERKKYEFAQNAKKEAEKRIKSSK